ncbi:unnamed protein product [Spirodela intermedia]|uniref:AT-hook motif nuclear-localized protein n=1 Tax=Spirodela intermedia TaxID=51605 RepID=A0A7I8LLQ0_SPIIN|nr:unnamed protein product [Spirodela intermedia]
MEGDGSISPGVTAAPPAVAEVGEGFHPSVLTRPESLGHSGGVTTSVTAAVSAAALADAAGSAPAPTASAAIAATGVAPAVTAGAAPATVSAAAAAVVSPPGSATSVGTAAATGTPILKKKRGRPRKYGPGGTLLMPLSPMPISASVPAGDIPVAAAAAMMMKRGRGRPGGSVNQHQRGVEMISFGESVAYSGGANFTPHIITVAAGEDVTMKVISFSQQGPRAICILSANGIISNVTLRQPDSSGGTLTYEGRFELLSLSGSFMPTESGGPRSRSGGMSVSLASPDGRVVGGGVAGLLVAASPVQVVVGSFTLGYQMEQKTKKLRVEPAKVSPALPPVQPAGGGGDVEETTYAAGQVFTAKAAATAAALQGESWIPSPHSVSEPPGGAALTDMNMSSSER